MEECVICLSFFEFPVQLDCNHNFCYQCMANWNKNSCPLCRTRIIDINYIKENSCYCNETTYNINGYCNLCNKKLEHKLIKSYFLNKIK